MRRPRRTRWTGGTQRRGVTRGDRWASQRLTEETAFSLLPLRSFCLPSPCPLWPPLPAPLRGELPARACTYLRLPTLVLPRCTCRAHESVRRGGRIKLQPGERVFGKVEATLNPFISRTSVLRIRLRTRKRNREGKVIEREIVQGHRRNFN